MVTDVTKLLKRLEIKDTGYYDNHFYIINFEDSNEYAQIYTKLDKNAVNIGYPSIEKNTNNSTTKIINYFEMEENEMIYDLFLFADFINDKYYLKISERDYAD